MPASLIGHSGLSAFRLSAATVLMSLAGGIIAQVVMARRRKMVSAQAAFSRKEQRRIATLVSRTNSLRPITWQRVGAAFAGRSVLGRRGINKFRSGALTADRYASCRRSDAVNCLSRPHESRLECRCGHTTTTAFCRVAFAARAKRANRAATSDCCSPGRPGSPWGRTWCPS
jgi:hypothetical protein